MKDIIDKVQELESKLVLGLINKKQYLKAIDELIQSEKTAEALEYLIRKKDIEI